MMEALEVGGSAGLGLGLVVVLVKLGMELVQRNMYWTSLGDFPKHIGHFKNVIV